MAETKFTTLRVYPDGPNEPGVDFKCANGFVTRVVSAVAESNLADADAVCRILNQHADGLGVISALDERGMWSNPETLKTAADEIDCDHSCDWMTHEYDTNFSMCRKSERGEYCPNDVAEALRGMFNCATLALAEGKQ
jgi:hypothetical protein